MDEKQNIVDFQMQIFHVFKSQNPEDDYLDVVFDIGGKKLYANKSRLSVVSPTFKSMLSKRWNSKNDEPIPINDYKFEDFKEFLTFIFSGGCVLTKQNIFAMIDIAEFYGVQIFKNYCDKFLSKMELNIENVFTILETSIRYSLFHTKWPLRNSVIPNFDDIVKNLKFLDSNKSVIENFVVFVQNGIAQEKIFQAIYEWAEHQAIKKQNESIRDNYDQIKTEITPFLPYIQLNKMSLKFLVRYVVKRSYIFPGDELSDILEKSLAAGGPKGFKYSYKYFMVKITNSNGQSISGFLPYNPELINSIKLLKNCLSNDKFADFIDWNTKCKIPSTPSPLRTREGVEWYLIFFHDGDIGIVEEKNVERYSVYLIAEMIPDSSEFIITKECKIEIC